MLQRLSSSLSSCTRARFALASIALILFLVVYHTLISPYSNSEDLLALTTPPHELRDAHHPVHAHPSSEFEIVSNIRAAVAQDLRAVAHSIARFATKLPVTVDDSSKDKFMCIDGPQCYEHGYNVPLLLWNRVFMLMSDVAPMVNSDYSRTAGLGNVDEEDKDSKDVRKSTFWKLRRNKSLEELLHNFWFLVGGGKEAEYKSLHPALCASCLMREIRDNETARIGRHKFASEKQLRRLRRVMAGSDEREHVIVFVPTDEMLYFIDSVLRRVGEVEKEINKELKENLCEHEWNGQRVKVRCDSGADSNTTTRTMAIARLFKKPLILVSGWTDPGPSFFAPKLAPAILKETFLKAWYAQNCDVPHDKMHCLPIGIDFHTVARHSAWGLPQMDATSQGRQLRNIALDGLRTQRDKRVVMDFALGTNTRARTSLYSQCAMKPWSKIALGKMKRLDTWRLYTQYLFVMSPPGNGYECHRTYEALALGAMPLMLHHPNPRMRHKIEQDLYYHMPVIFLDDFASNISEDVMNGWWHQLAWYVEAEAIDSKLHEISGWRRKLSNFYWFEKVRLSLL